ncbi:hypothetical protein FA95DRAFT_1567170, partial [Auriscalpium vulgare]
MSPAVWPVHPRHRPGLSLQQVFHRMRPVAPASHPASRLPSTNTTAHSLYPGYPYLPANSRSLSTDLRFSVLRISLYARRGGIPWTCEHHLGYGAQLIQIQNGPKVACWAGSVRNMLLLHFDSFLWLHASKVACGPGVCAMVMVFIILPLDSYGYTPRRSPVDRECVRWLWYSSSFLSIRTVTCLEGRLRTGSVRD